jgi:hypothetical protein
MHHCTTMMNSLRARHDSRSRIGTGISNLKYRAREAAATGRRFSEKGSNDPSRRGWEGGKHYTTYLGTKEGEIEEASLVIHPKRGQPLPAFQMMKWWLSRRAESRTRTCKAGQSTGCPARQEDSFGLWQYNYVSKNWFRLTTHGQRGHMV